MLIFFTVLFLTVYAKYIVNKNQAWRLAAILILLNVNNVHSIAAGITNFDLISSEFNLRWFRQCINNKTQQADKITALTLKRMPDFHSVTKFNSVTFSG